VTGINGRIGRILRSSLAKVYDTVGIDKQGPFSARVLRADIADYGRLEEVFSALGPAHYLLHLAADAAEDAKWDSILKHNIIGTRNVFKAARGAGVQRLVFASSNHVTGAYEGYPPDRFLHTQFEPPRISSGDPIRPDGYYGVSKAFGEALARYFSSRWEIGCVCLRIGSVLKEDDPAGDPRHMKTWLSHRDLIQLVMKSLSSNVAFGIYYGVSDNQGRFWDITNARVELGFEPQDDASRLQAPER
jgi:nucleoside-diphosphate-sugar epimerase